MISIGLQFDTQCTRLAVDQELLDKLEDGPEKKEKQLALGREMYEWRVQISEEIEGIEPPSATVTAAWQPESKTGPPLNAQMAARAIDAAAPYIQMDAWDEFIRNCRETVRTAREIKEAQRIAMEWERQGTGVEGE